MACPVALFHRATGQASENERVRKN